MTTKKTLLIALAGSFLQIISISANAQVSFSGPTNFTSGPGPISVANGDFNDDGNIDLATANGQANVGGNSVSVLLNDGLGGFDAPVHFGNTVTSNFIISADFNGDDTADIATTDPYQNAVSVFIGNGDGSFMSPATFSVGNSPISLTSGDFNNDGNIDIATANSSGSGSASVLFGTGTGSFASAITLATSYGPYSLIAGDFTNDGNDDLAVACQDLNNNISIFISNGNAGFSTATNFTVSGYPHTIITDDFNGDTNADLAVGYHYNSNNRVIVLTGNGAGNFTNKTPVSVTSDPYVLTSADFNFDGKKDIAVSLRYLGSAGVVIGDGTGNFGTPTFFTLGNDSWGIVNADYNNDGKADLAVTNYVDNNISILLNNTPPPISPLCVVTVDSTFNYNVVIWEKTNLNMPVIDSFVVYREITTNNYQRIGAVHADSLSSFNDIAANPAITGYRYKLKSKDALGVESPFNDYHNSIYLTNTGANFSWTPYQIENNTTPVASYNVFRDDISSGNFQLIGSTTGNQLGYTDINFSTYPNASYYVEAVMTNGTCNPTRSGYDASRSNIKYFGTTTIQPININASITISPNPANSTLLINGGSLYSNLIVYNILGEIVLKTKITNQNITLDVHELTEGVYTIALENSGSKVFKKIVVNH